MKMAMALAVAMLLVASPAAGIDEEFLGRGGPEPRRASALGQVALGPVGPAWQAAGRASADDLNPVAAGSAWGSWLEQLDSLKVRLHSREGLAGESHELAAPPAGANPYFRPVSTTVQCVMALTIVSIVFYTALSISRNVDELSGEFKPSVITQTLTAASRGAALAPMLCMICVGCRMFVLATTLGLGEPPQWVKFCMYLATGGVCFQFIIVVLLRIPATGKIDDDDDAEYDMTEGKAALAKKAREAKEAKQAKDAAGVPPRTAAVQAEEATEKANADETQLEAEDFDKATGDLNDAHPVLNKIRYRDGTEVLKPVFLCGLLASMVAIYGGVAGIMVCILTYPEQHTPLAPAVKCTVILTALYYVSFMFLWACRMLPESETQKKVLQAALSTSTVVRKAPMFAVLFLATRMRAEELDPPYGMPPRWMQLFFFAITTFVYLETFAAAVVGFTGKQSKAYYGVYVYRCESRAAHAVQHSCAMITYLALIPIAVGAALMTDRSGNSAPFSTAFSCTLVLDTVYFGIMFGQTVVFAIEDLIKLDMIMLQDTFVAAGISVGFAPLLCILFVATRMRALQITQMMGAPPGWAQDCMKICVFGTCVQSLCCLVMPIFIGSACKVDEDGNPDYDLRPMIGAYAVTVVKYVALMSIHGGVFVICIAVFVMTPETAHSGGSFMQGGHALLRAIAGAFAVLIMSLLFSSAKVIGMAVKMAIESCDRIFLGVDITIKHAALGICKGYVSIKDLVVHQPDEEIIYAKNEAGTLVGTPTGKKLEWDHDYILKIKTVIVKINMWRLVTTLGKEFELENLSFTGIHANIEKPSSSMKQQDSNIDYLLNHIDSLGLTPPPAEERAAADAKAAEAKKKETEAARKAAEAEAAKKAAAEAAQAKDPKTGESPAFIPKVILRKIALGDIGVGVTVKNVPIAGTIKFHPAIGLIVFENIQDSVFGGKEDLTPQETVACIIKAVAKKIMNVVVVDLPKQLARTSGEMAKKAAQSSLEGMKKMGQSIKGAFGRMGGSSSAKTGPTSAASASPPTESPPSSP